jgi:hypothetical protein
MSDKTQLCCGCGKFRADGAYVDLGDGLGLAWTCPDCVERLAAGQPTIERSSTP